MSKKPHLVRLKPAPVQGSEVPSNSHSAKVSVPLVKIPQINFVQAQPSVKILQKNVQAQPSVQIKQGNDVQALRMHKKPTLLGLELAPIQGFEVLYNSNPVEVSSPTQHPSYEELKMDFETSHSLNIPKRKDVKTQQVPPLDSTIIQDSADRNHSKESLVQTRLSVKTPLRDNDQAQPSVKERKNVQAQPSVKERKNVQAQHSVKTPQINKAQQSFKTRGSNFIKAQKQFKVLQSNRAQALQSLKFQQESRLYSAPMQNPIVPPRSASTSIQDLPFHAPSHSTPRRNPKVSGRSNSTSIQDLKFLPRSHSTPITPFSSSDSTTSDSPIEVNASLSEGKSQSYSKPLVKNQLRSKIEGQSSTKISHRPRIWGRSSTKISHRIKNALVSSGSGSTSTEVTSDSTSNEDSTFLPSSDFTPIEKPTIRTRSYFRNIQDPEVPSCSNSLSTATGVSISYSKGRSRAEKLREFEMLNQEKEILQRKAEALKREIMVLEIQNKNMMEELAMKGQQFSYQPNSPVENPKSPQRKGEEATESP